MELKDIGFYTLSNKRAATTSATSPLQRCELILTTKCNFRCPYCMPIQGVSISKDKAFELIDMWAEDNLFALRLSGGEPMLVPWLPELVSRAKTKGIQRIAISTNGSASLKRYLDLVDRGVDDISISLDGCCAEDIDKMTGGVKGQWKRIKENIRELSKLTYVTVGIVLTPDNMEKANLTIQAAANLGVSDIRVIPAVQEKNTLPDIGIDPSVLDKYPILQYRIRNLLANDSVRGMRGGDSKNCWLVIDDMAVHGEDHYPCIIYFRQYGKPIGKVGPYMREERVKWAKTNDCSKNPICSSTCLDVCRDYNNKCEELGVANRITGR